MPPKANMFTYDRAQRRGELIHSEAAVNPASILDAAVGTGSVTIAGAAIGDEVAVMPGVAIAAGVTVTASVSAANTVAYTIRNNSGGAVDLASSTWRFVIRKYRLTS